MSDQREKAIGLAGTVLAILCTYYLRNVRMEMQEKAKESGAKKEEKLSSSGFESLAGCIYCDYNATTPIYPEVFQAMEPYLTKCFGNPSSSHAYGQFAKTAVITGRKLVADAVNAKPEDIYFVSCGSEADNRCIDIAIHNFYLTHDASSIPQIITSSIEHPAILCYLRTMQLKKKLELKVVPVDSQGFVSLTEFENALSPNVALATIMHSNNEIGTIEPIRAMSKIIRRYNKKANTNILFHTDAAQSIGKVVVDVNALDVDMLTIVGHKFGAPKGIAALYVRNGVNICQFLIGGSQEKGFRAGTENVPYIVALGEASRIVTYSTSEYILRMLRLKVRLMKKFAELLGDKIQYVKYNGPARANTISTIEEDLKMLKFLLKPKKESTNSTTSSASSTSTNDMIEQLPNTISISFKNLVGHELVEALSQKVAVSTGSACHALPSAHDSNVYTPSEVLQALGVSNEYGIGTLRLSLGRFTTEEEVDSIGKFISEEVLKQWQTKL